MRHILVWVGLVVGWCSYVIGIRKKLTLKNLAIALPSLPERERKIIARQSYANLCRVFAEILYLRYARLSKIKAKTRIVNPELYEKALLEGKGLVVVAAHYANWEWLALGGALALHSNFAIVRKNVPSHSIEKFLDKLRIRSGNSQINSGDIRAMLQALRDGKCLAILGDQAAPTESVKVNFLGTQTPTFEGPAVLSIRTGAPMLFAECNLVEGGVYEIVFHPIGVTPTDTIESLTQKHTSQLEEIILKRPEFWLWQHNRWKNTFK
jgi:KDO2-lipid IV(A) lauroyltransferase